MRSIGIVVAERGAAIVSVERSPEDALLVVGIERLPATLAAVLERVRELDDPEARFVVDADGLGSAVWAALDPPDDEPRWQLYSERGRERQRLVDELLVAIEAGRFHFAAGLAEQTAMSRALAGYHREVRDDGAIGSELVVALLLAISPPPPEPVEPAIIFGRPRMSEGPWSTPHGAAYRVFGPSDD